MNVSRARNWDQLGTQIWLIYFSFFYIAVEDIADDKFDLGVGDLSITSERLTKIDFSTPISYTGIIILAKQSLEKTDIFSFLNPFSTEVWLGIILAFIFILLLHNIFHQ